MLSVHTSPLDQPGTGDAGGMNVYVVELSKALARLGTGVEIFTRATASDQEPVVELADGVVVRHIEAGPFEGLAKTDLPGQLCAFTAGVLRTEASKTVGWYGAVHSHYWLSGHVGWLAAERWQVPLIHSMHTMAKVKNLALGPGDSPEPRGRVIGEEQVVAAADQLVANTDSEAQELIGLYGADPDRVSVVSPGVDLAAFSPGGPGGRDRARDLLGLPRDRDIVLFAGRIQPLKAPDVLVRALGVLRRTGQPVPLLVVLGGPSGDAGALAQLQRLAHEEGIADHVRWHPPVARDRLVQWYRAADVVAVPSRSESFGLVAAEAQATATPVIAAAVGGLLTVVADEESGLLVRGHDPAHWAQQLRRILGDVELRGRLSVGARNRASELGWDQAAVSMRRVYRAAQAQRQTMVDTEWRSARTEGSTGVHRTQLHAAG